MVTYLRDEFSDAITSGEVAKVRALLAGGYVLGTQPARQGVTRELHLAASRLCVDVAKVLIEHGADVNGVDSFGRTPLHWVFVGASFSGEGADRYEIVQTLLKAGADPNLMDEDGFCVLRRLLCRTQHKGGEWTMEQATKLFRLLVEHGANTSHPGSAPGKPTPFQIAVGRNMVPIVAYCLAECGEDVAQRSANGKTLIQVAGKHAEMKALLRSAKTDLAIQAAVESVSENPLPAPRKRAGLAPL